MNFTCPYCFSRLESGPGCFECGNPECVAADIPYTEFKLERPLRRVDPLDSNSPVAPEDLRHLESRPFVFPPKAGGFFGLFSGRKNAKSAECPKCGKKTATRACPICHSTLPYGIDEWGGKTIAVIGAKEAGKSHYIAVLIRQIKQLSYRFGWSLHAMTDETLRLYETRFYNPLYERRETIRATAAADIDAHKPLFYSLKMRQSDENLILVFFDTAGENLDSEARFSKINRYITSAAGIILLLDPLQIPRVRAQLPKAALPNENSETGTILQRAAKIIRAANGIPPGEKIPIPLAVAFSKMDAVREVLGDDAPPYLGSHHQGGYSLSDGERNHRFVSNWIAYLDESGTIRDGLASFAHLGFFGVSALGCDPQATQRLLHAPRPIRVEDPFLWILYQYGLIDTIR